MKYHSNLTFNPVELSYDNPVREVFDCPRLAVIWCIRKSKHMVDTKFIDSCKQMYYALIDGMPRTFIEFYAIASKYCVNETLLYVTKKSLWQTVELVYSDANFTNYWEPFYHCWMNPHNLTLNTPDGIHELSLLPLSQEREIVNNLRQQKRIDQEWKLSVELFLQEKIAKQLTNKTKQYRKCINNNLILTSDSCPVCGGINCIERITAKEALALIGIDMNVTDEDYMGDIEIVDLDASISRKCKYPFKT